MQGHAHGGQGPWSRAQQRDAPQALPICFPTFWEGSVTSDGSLSHRFPEPGVRGVADPGSFRCFIQLRLLEPEWNQRCAVFVTRVDLTLQPFPTLQRGWAGIQPRGRSGAGRWVGGAAERVCSATSASSCLRWG